MDEDNLLDDLLSSAINELEEKIDNTDNVATKRTLKETDIFNKQSNIPEPNNTTKTRNNSTANKSKLSLIHSGDTDSSDDEDNKYHEDQKYNQSGKDIKHLLQQSTSSLYSKDEHQRQSTWKTKPPVQELAAKANPVKNSQKEDVYTDPVFGLRIVKPLVSFTTLQDRMVGREAVSFARIKKFVSGNIGDKNWVIAGVIANRSSVRTSQKGNQFLIWTLSDLKNDIKTVSVFLFKSAYKQLWKTAIGTVVGVLNATVFDRKEGSKDEACLSVDNSQKVMILGQSRDLGTCKSVKKNGEPCTSIVNTNNCAFCVYHIKQEYQKCSTRSELQSNFSGRGLTALRNKVLGKNEVFYAGKLYTAIPAKRSKKLEEKDRGRLQSLSNSNANSPRLSSGNNLPKKKKAAANLDISHHQRLKDLTLLEKLGGNAKTDFQASHSSEVTLESSKNTALSVIKKLTEKNKEGQDKSTDESGKSNPSCNIKLPAGNPALNFAKKVIDLNVSASRQQVSRAKLNALKYIQKNGTLKKSDPNSVKTQTPATGGTKRVLELDEGGNNPKKARIEENEFISDRFKKMMEATSKHADLLNARDDEEAEKYFYKMEMKEKMEEKMINTFKVPCKAVQCLKCKYTNFSASERCKDEKHPLKVYDAFKRFFKCGNCGNRTQSLDIIPTTSCNNCGSGKWERTGMMKERTVTMGSNLSIRGGEQTFVNSVVTNANLDLMVPDS